MKTIKFSRAPRYSTDSHEDYLLSFRFVNKKKCTFIEHTTPKYILPDGSRVNRFGDICSGNGSLLHCEPTRGGFICVYQKIVDRLKDFPNEILPFIASLTKNLKRNDPDSSIISFKNKRFQIIASNAGYPCIKCLK